MFTSSPVRPGFISRLLSLVSLLFVLFVVAGCLPAVGPNVYDPQPLSPPPSILNSPLMGIWMLQELRIDKVPHYFEDAAPVQISFSEYGDVTVRDECNTGWYYVTYSPMDAQYDIGTMVGSTLQGCYGALATQVALIHDSLRATHSWRVEDGWLILSGENVEMGLVPDPYFVTPEPGAGTPIAIVGSTTPDPTAEAYTHLHPMSVRAARRELNLLAKAETIIAAAARDVPSFAGGWMDWDNRLRIVIGVADEADFNSVEQIVESHAYPEEYRIVRMQRSMQELKTLLAAINDIIAQQDDLRAIISHTGVNVREGLLTVVTSDMGIVSERIGEGIFADLGLERDDFMLDFQRRANFTPLEELP